MRILRFLLGRLGLGQPGELDIPRSARYPWLSLGEQQASQAAVLFKQDQDRAKARQELRAEQLRAALERRTTAVLSLLGASQAACARLEREKRELNERFTRIAPVLVHKGMRVHECGTPNPDGARFCRHCGKTLTYDLVNENEETQTPAPKPADDYPYRIGYRGISQP
jgi:hypothetical protein